MEKKRPQLNLTELYQLKWVLGGLLAVLSAWTVLYMDVEAWLWLVLITVTVPVVMRWPVLTLYVPRWAHRLAFPLFVALFATDYYFNREPLPAMIRLALMLVFYRAVTPRKRRDDLQLIVLGLFLVVVAGVLSVSLAFALQIVVFTGCTLLFLLVITLIDSAEAGQVSAPFSAAAPPPWMRIEWLRLARRLRETSDWRVVSLASGLFAGVVGLSALLFFALPRFEIGNSFFLDNMISKKSRTGFSESVRFGDVTDIQQDTSVALRVQVSDLRAIPADPYWRMLVLDSYADGVFSVSNSLSQQVLPQKKKSARVVGSARPRLNEPVWVFYLEGGISRYLPLLGSFNQVQFDGGAQEYAINDELRILRLEKVPPKMFAYRVEGMRFEPELGKIEIAQKRDPIAPPQEFPDEIDGRKREPSGPPTFLTIKLEPEDAAKVEQWVKMIGAPPGDVRTFARLASAWLNQNHAYSLRMEQGEGRDDPLVRWMGSSLPGHCELFAGSFTLLARTAGYPSRMVTGFHGGSWNEGSGHLSIRNSDAHAWCEIYDAASKTWMRVDPTPGARGPEQASAVQETTEAVLARIRDNTWSAKLDTVRMFWYRRIVDFDQSSQVELARDAKSAIESQAKKLKKWINHRLERISEWLQEPWDVARLGAWLFVIGTAFGVVLGWRSYGRGLWLRWRSGLTRNGVDPVRREAGRWLRKLSARGLHTGDVRAELERLRYGPRSSWPNPQGVFRRAKRALKSGMANQATD
ncbi:transglutaminaseTgpA domain-containing protein [Rariglobus hedericola]|uniref:DUF3488 domain-containing protein n=1 Tax=Rariglobus hedericola TaxID=2597822 RepID=A0A556QR99_9BACT|nr:DUF3488 and transglutaminase-like domain-containing protein [Rariglobus hedericola]TSJ79161.1 DUF3488 domain-containing protein [Rariglobus hedericola]